MATSLRPCPSCGRPMDVNRSLCVFCMSGTQTIQDPTIFTSSPVAPDPPSSRPGVLIAAGVVGVVAVLALGVFMGTRLRPAAPPAPVVKQPSPDELKRQQAQAAQARKKAAADAEAIRVAQWRNEGMRLQIQGNQARKDGVLNPTAANNGFGAPAQMPPPQAGFGQNSGGFGNSGYAAPAQPAAPTPAANNDMRQIFGILDQIEGGYQQALGAVRTDNSAKATVARFNAGIKAGKTAFEATLEREGANPYFAPADVRHFYACLSAYEDAGKYLDYYLVFDSQDWLIKSGESHAEALSERNAFAIVTR